MTLCAALPLTALSFGAQMARANVGRHRPSVTAAPVTLASPALTTRRAYRAAQPARRPGRALARRGAERRLQLETID